MVLTRREILENTERGAKRKREEAVRRVADLLVKRQSRRPERGGMIPNFETRRAIPSVSYEDESSIIDGLVPDVEEVYSERGNLVISNLDRSLFSNAGFDLRVGEEVYRSDCLRKRLDLKSLRGFAESGKMQRLEPKDGKFVLEPDLEGNNFYYVVSFESILLPDDLELLVDARSTTGRLGCMCTEVSKKVLRRGEESPVIICAQPYVFPLEIEIGKSRLIGAVLRYRDSEYMTKKEILEDGGVELYNGNGKIDLGEDGRIGRDGLLMTYSTGRVFIAKLSDEVPGPINVDAREVYEQSDYFDEIIGNSEVVMDGKRFYLFGTEEEIRLKNACGLLSRENEDTGTGLWGHFAGTIWPGFEGRITMECRSGAGRIISSGDEAGFVRMDRLEGEKNKNMTYVSDYQHQEVPKVPKVFKN